MADGPEPVAVAAPAKINLYLHVTGKRPDGYHLLDSLIAFADIHDTVIAEPAPDLSLQIEGPFADSLGAGEDNLVIRAARALAEAAGVAPAAGVRLIKRLPVAAGIGGGSSDAAAALRALSTLWRVQPGRAALQRIALGLGADVPVCLNGVAAQVGGVGEIIESAVRFPATPVVLINPGVALSTARVFEARRGDYSKPMPLDAECDTPAALARELGARRNDLAAPASELVPAIAEILAALDAAEGCVLARMSGSGATCFGLFAHEQEAARAAAAIGDQHKEWWVRAGRIVGRIDSLEPMRGE